MALEFPRDLKQFCGISKGGDFCLEFPVVKWKKQKLQGGFKKVCPQHPIFGFFLEDTNAASTELFYIF